MTTLPEGDGPVVVDTGVFAAVMLGTSRRLREQYASPLRGRTLILATQTVAELRFAARNSRWPATQRSTLDDRLRGRRIAPVDDELIDAYVRLRADCKAEDHPMGLKFQHEQDRWIAATALRYSVPLVAHDKAFFGVPELQFITALPAPS